VPADRYEAAFDAAAGVLSDHGLSPAIRDRRSGVIETDPEASVGWFAPWSLEPASSLEDVATLSTIRRRARVTFTPPRFAEEEPGPLPGPDLLGLREPPADLTDRTGPLDMRVAIFVERSHRPGLRVDTWSRRNVSQARVARPAPESGFEPARTWWPVARDEGLERALLAEIVRRIGPEPEPETEPETEPGAAAGTLPPPAETTGSGAVAATPGEAAATAAPPARAASD